MKVSLQSPALVLAALIGISLAPASLAQAADPPRGSLAAIGPRGTATGWAHDNSARAVEVYFSVDAPAGTVLPALRVLASELRSDVNRIESVEGDHGFRYTIPTRYRDGRAHVLYAYARDPRRGNLVELAGSPRHFHLFQSEAPAIPQRWYEDNNLASEYGAPLDFAARYAPERLESWRRARETMDVFMLRSSVYTRHVLGNPELKRRFAAAHQGTPICLDDTSAIWAHRRNPTPTYAGGMFVIQDLKDLGLNVESVALQSVLDKPHPDRVFYPMADRVRDVVEYVRIAKGRWPDLRIGLIDSMPSHAGLDWRTAYLMLRNALRQEGLTLDFLLLDMPMAWATAEGGFATASSVKAYAQNVMGWSFGWTVSLGLPGAASDAEYRTALLAGLQSFLERGFEADFFAVMSWSTHPEQSAPDSISLRRPTTTSMFREVDHRLPR